MVSDEDSEVDSLWLSLKLCDSESEVEDDRESVGESEREFDSDSDIELDSDSDAEDDKLEV